MRKYLLTILISFTQLVVNASDGEWVLAKDENGIKIYTRTKEGYDIKEFKATASFQVHRLVLEEILLDFDEFKNWYPDIIDSYTIQKLNTNESYIYYSVDIPWPSDDRDAVMKVKVKRFKKTKTTIIYHDAVSGVKEELDDYVRMTSAKGFWKLVSNGSSTDIIYQFHGDPGGSLPAWMINLFIVDNPYSTLAALKEQATKS